MNYYQAKYIIFKMLKYAALAKENQLKEQQNMSKKKNYTSSSHIIFSQLSLCQTEQQYWIITYNRQSDQEDRCFVLGTLILTSHEEEVEVMCSESDLLDLAEWLFAVHTLD